jgi:hypothetical protein
MVLRAARWVLLVEKEFTNDLNGVCGVQSKAYTGVITTTVLIAYLFLLTIVLSVLHGITVV